MRCFGGRARWAFLLGGEAGGGRSSASLEYGRCVPFDPVYVRLPCVSAGGGFVLYVVAVVGDIDSIRALVGGVFRAKNRGRARIGLDFIRLQETRLIVGKSNG